MRTRLVLLLVLVGLAVLGGAAWHWSATHPVLPGMGGCELVRDRPARVDCIGERMHARIESDGVRPALVALKEEDRSKRFWYECHDGMHRAGWHVVRAGTEPVEAYRESSGSDVDWICDGGLMHGIFQETSKRSKGDFGRLGTLCGATQDIGRRVACFHSLGHGLVSGTGSAASADTDRCYELGDSNVDVVNCASGLWMQVALFEGGEADPDRICDDVPAHDAYACGLNVPEAYQADGRALTWKTMRAACERTSDEVAVRAGCIAKGAMWVHEDAGGVDDCAAFADAAVRAACAFALAMPELEEGRAAAVELCEAGDAEVLLGCAAGVGHGSRTSHDEAEPDAACDGWPAGSATHGACLAGHHNCWPIPPGPAEERACRDRVLPGPALPARDA